MAQTGEGRLNSIAPNQDYLEKLQICRKELPAEAFRCGKLLAQRLIRTFYAMRRQLFAGYGVVLNEAALLQACIAFWEDILRIKGFHPINCADRHKKAAYIFKWVAKMKPVKAIGDKPDLVSDKELNSNAIYALLSAFGFLKCSLSVLYSPVIKPFLYAATYREIDPDAWTIIFEYFEDKYSDNQ